MKQKPSFCKHLPLVPTKSIYSLQFSTLQGKAIESQGDQKGKEQSLS